jgi:hypothetical protein
MPSDQLLGRHLLRGCRSPAGNRQDDCRSQNRGSLLDARVCDGHVEKETARHHDDASLLLQALLLVRTGT